MENTNGYSRWHSSVIYGSGANVVINENSVNSFTEDRFDFIRGMLYLPKFIGMSLLPLCFIFVPYSIISLIKKENNNFRYLIFLGIFFVNTSTLCI